VRVERLRWRGRQETLQTAAEPCAIGPRYNYEDNEDTENEDACDITWTIRIEGIVVKLKLTGVGAITEAA